MISVLLSFFLLCSAITVTLKGSTNSPACAACKYQRRKCPPSCPLAPYFPSDEPKIFLNVHRLYGVSNVTKVLKNLENKVERDDAMKSIIYESEMRERFPVHACSLVIGQLRFQIHHANQELLRVQTCLAKYKDQQQRFNNNINLVDPPGNINLNHSNNQFGELVGMVPCENSDKYFLNGHSDHLYDESLDYNNMSNPLPGSNPYSVSDYSSSTQLQLGKDAFRIREGREFSSRDHKHTVELQAMGDDGKQSYMKTYRDDHHASGSKDKQSYMKTYEDDFNTTDHDRQSLMETRASGSNDKGSYMKTSRTDFHMTDHDRQSSMETKHASQSSLGCLLHHTTLSMDLHSDLKSAAAGISSQYSQPE